MSIATASVWLDEEPRALIFFPCPSCGHRVYGNYCSNCGKKVTQLSNVDCIRVDLTVAAGILEEALETIAESIYRKGVEEGASEEEIVERIKARFDVPEKFKAR